MRRLVAGTEGRYDPRLTLVDVRPLLFPESFVSLRIQEQTLRTLIAAGSVSELTAQRSNGGWVLMLRVGTVDTPLELQRGGAREFKSLDVLASLVESIGLASFSVSFAKY